VDKKKKIGQREREREGESEGERDCVKDSSEN
jgi:hypothetical protein